ncbi:MAG: metal-dependent hydrolase [Parcubacteria group bacterium]|jgi:hypothetical protein
MFLDIGVGILISIIVSYIFNIDFSIWLIIFGIICTLLPDADFIYFYPKRHDTKYDHKHRDLIHYPLLYLPIGTILILVIFGKIWAIVFFVASFLHFLHDSVGIGWGIKWLYPFTKNNYSFFYLYSRIKKRGRRKFVFIFNEKNLPELVAKHGDPNWVENIYYKWHPIAQVEFGVFIVSLIILYFYVK